MHSNISNRYANGTAPTAEVTLVRFLRTLRRTHEERWISKRSYHVLFKNSFEYLASLPNLSTFNLFFFRVSGKYDFIVLLCFQQQIIVRIFCVIYMTVVNINFGANMYGTWTYISVNESFLLSNTCSVTWALSVCANKTYSVTRPSLDLDE